MRIIGMWINVIKNRAALIFLMACSVFSLPLLAAPDFSAMKQSAILAGAAYGEKVDIQKTLSDLKLPFIQTAVLPGSEVSYFLTNIHQEQSSNKQAKTVQMIAVRGTANLQNVMVDLDVNFVQDKILNIQVHQGFASAAQAVYNHVKPLLKKDMAVQTTGHSLGGAVAVILAMYLQKDGYNIQPFMTFGQPKVSNVGGTQAFPDLPLTRVVTKEDIVPLVPPLSPLQLSNLDIYWHSGEEVILLKAEKYSITSGLKSMARATKFTSALPREDNLNAHKMTTYLNLIESKLHQAKEVPYKTGISVFGMSFD
jgi:triacylglycerol lipase